MTIVQAETDEVIAALSLDDARSLTESIKASSQRLYQLVLDAHEGKAHKALGYPTWEEYCQSEFDMSRVHSYALIDQGRVIRAIERSAKMSGAPDISGREARDIKPKLEAVTEAISERIAEEVDPDADEDTQEVQKRRIAQEEVTKARTPKPEPEPEPEPESEPDHEAEALEGWLDEQPDVKRKALEQSVQNMWAATSKVVADIDPTLAASFTEPDSLNYRQHSTERLIEWLTEYRSALGGGLHLVKGGSA